jgi:hypothetical protein
MLDPIQATPRRTVRTQGGKLPAGATVDSLRKFEAKTIHARLLAEREEERRRHALLGLLRMWPVGVGLLLAAIAPQLRDLVSLFGAWGMWLVFPFVEIASRNAIHSGGISQILPTILLYAQFPLEGLLARMFLRNRVTLSGVGRHLLFYHVIGVLQLLLASGTIWRLATR